MANRAALVRQPQPFFANKARAFWTLQILGWIGWLILRAVSGVANGQSAGWLVTQFISGITGFSLTLLMSVAYRMLIHRRPFVTWSGSLMVAAAAAILWGFTDTWVVDLQNRSGSAPFTTLFLGAFFLSSVTLAAWSSLYFAINFFLQVEEQADRMQMLEAQATAAQLAMLRYQINPHFLFNTLNSISTLVMLKQSEPANAMLSRLSSFLRYTLVNEPTSLVTLEQEVETLKLYLDIEKMRFEERLRVRFDVDPRVTGVRIPSLLLQPLVENAIKYAVTPNEDGADIVLSAHLAGQNVRIIVSDSGPGLNPGGGETIVSTGVGLANIRERLVQAFGPAQRFEARQATNGGFTVSMEVPLGEVPVADVAAPPSETKANENA